jgi:methyl-accepting chemotaxis protein
MDASVSVMSAVVQDVESGAEKAREAGDGLRRIVEVSQELAGEVTTIEQSTGTADSAATTLSEVIEQVGALAQENNALVDQMREQSGGVMEQIDSASSAAEESAASSQEVSASAEEVTAQVAEMSGQAEGLNDIATELSTFLQWLGHRPR